MAEKVKSNNEILKEKALEKAKEVIALSLEKSWDKIWTTKNRVIKAGSESMTIGASLKFDKVTEEQMNIICTPTWQEAHKGSKAAGEVNVQDDLFTPAESEDDDKDDGNVDFSVEE